MREKKWNAESKRWKTKLAAMSSDPVGFRREMKAVAYRPGTYKVEPFTPTEGAWKGQTLMMKNYDIKVARVNKLVDIRPRPRKRQKPV